MLYKTTHGLIICYLLCLHHQYCRRYVRPPNHKNKNSAVSWWQRKELWTHSAFSFCRCNHLGILKRHVQFGALEIRFRFMTCSEGDVSTYMSTCTHQKPSETWPYLFVTPCHCDLYVPSENLPWVPKGTLHPSAHHMSLRKSHKNYTNEDDTNICAQGICQDPSFSPSPKPHHGLLSGPTCYSFPFWWQLRLSPPGFHSPRAHSMQL